MKNTIRIRSFLVICIALYVVWFGQTSCLRSLDPSGAPCRNDADCWSTHFCVSGKCQSSTEPPTQETKPEAKPEPRPEPRPEPEITKEPTPDANESMPEPRPEPKPEITPDLGPAGNRKLYEPCAWYDWARDDERCQTGLRCVRVSAIKSICLTDCTFDENKCKSHPDGLTTCLNVAYEEGQFKRACAKLIDRDQSCDPGRGKYCHSRGDQSAVCRTGKCLATTVVSANASCNPNDSPPKVCDYTRGLFCGSNGTCVSGTKLMEFDRCNSGTCEYGLDCSAPQTDGARYCIKRCKQDDDCKHWSHPSSCFNGLCIQSKCRGDFDCLFLRDAPTCEAKNGVNLCLIRIQEVIGKKGFDEPCRRTGDEACKAGLRCLQFTNTHASCTLHCNEDKDCTRYDKRFTCHVQSNNGFRFCGQRCSNNTDCPNGEVCYGRTACGPG